jgi:hypothetical protein
MKEYKDCKFVSAKDCKIKEVTDCKDEYVYDMEVADGSHTFFTNGILVHNSIYVRMDNILKLLFKGKTDVDWYDDKVFQKIKSFVDDKFQEVLNNHVTEFICSKFKTSEKRIAFKREKISSEGNYLSKKRYVVHVRDNEGVECDKFSYTGVDIEKNELPSKLKKMMQALVEKMMKERLIGNDVIHKELEKIYNEFKALDINDVGFIKNLSTPKHALYFMKMPKGAGVHARAAEMYNQLITALKLESKYELIRQSDRFHYIYIKTNNKYNIDCIAWKDKYPKEFESLFEIDIETMFRKTIMAPLKKFLINHKADEYDPSVIIMLGENNESIFDL